MELVVSPVLHKYVIPVPPGADNTELPQLFVVEIDGADGIALTVNIAALEFTVPAIFVHTAR